MTTTQRRIAMTRTAHPRPTDSTSDTTTETTTRPRARRRAAVAVTGAIACLLPTVWAATFLHMLASGELADHRFHQLTGQGLLVTAVWLGAVVPLVVAGWRGRRPATGPALLHVTFVGVGAACAVAAPQGGAPSLMVLIGVTGVLVWLALPLRPRLRGIGVELAPVSLAAALLTSAAVAPYAVSQIGLQHLATGHHAGNPHYFDMAWLVLTLAVAGVLGSLVSSARDLQVWAGAGVLATGVAMLLLGEGAVRGGSFVVTGGLLLGAWALLRRGSSSAFAGHGRDA
jgi:hypothetical protein